MKNNLENYSESLLTNQNKSIKATLKIYKIDLINNKEELSNTLNYSGFAAAMEVIKAFSQAHYKSKNQRILTAKIKNNYNIANENESTIEITLIYRCSDGVNFKYIYTFTGQTLAYYYDFRSY